MKRERRSGKPVRLIPRCKLWLRGRRGEGIFGDGKWRLLKAIEQTGSLSAACGQMGISYRKAWGELRKAELRLGVELVERRRGGKSGGGTRLTESGKTWCGAYEHYRRDIERAIEKAYDKHIKDLLEKNK